MRRILLMLPVLALVACQADLPTEADTMQGQQVDGHDPPDTWLVDRGIILVDAVVDSASEKLMFYVKNPGYGMPPCVEGASNWAIEALAFPRRDRTPIAEHHLTWAECNWTTYWPLYTMDYVPDFAFSIVGSTVCDVLTEEDAKHVSVVATLISAVSPDTARDWRTFRIQCPYLN